MAAAGIVALMLVPGVLAAASAVAGLQASRTSASIPQVAPTAPWTDGPLENEYKKTADNASWDKLPIQASGRKIAGDVFVKVTGIWAKAHLKIEIVDNQIGGNLTVLVEGNPFLLDLIVNVSGNRVGGFIYVSASYNAVSNIYFFMYGNRACSELEAKIFDNSVDFALLAYVADNRAMTNFKLDVSANFGPWPDLFHTLDVAAVSDHAVNRNLEIQVIGNTMAKQRVSPTMFVEVRLCGAGRQMDVLVNGNSAKIGTIEILVIFNEADYFLNVSFQGNIASVLKMQVAHNYSCAILPRISTQLMNSKFDNIQKCMQQIPPDADMDGLTDRYEKMIGTDPSKKDTDSDGLADGWDDANGNMAWDAGERYGEVGDPTGRYYHGSIMHLVTPGHEPKCLCADIYVEIDHIKDKGAAKDLNEFTDASANKVWPIFKKHRIFLHIDNGWKNKGGGQSLKCDCEEVAGRRYLSLDPVAGKADDFYDFKNDRRYFDPDRKDIFHYAIVADYFSWIDAAGNKQYGNTASGLSEVNGDDYMLGGEVIRNWVTSNYPAVDVPTATLEISAKTFMHELGHNLNLLDTYAAADEAVTVMYGYISKTKPLDYKAPTEWAGLKLDCIINPMDTN